jgi:general secretion pathway protein E
LDHTGIHERSAERLGGLLLDKKLITEADLRRAHEQRRLEGTSLAAALINLRLFSEQNLAPLVAEELGVSFVRPSASSISREALEKLPAKYAHHYRVVPVDLDSGTLVLASSNPSDPDLLDELSALLGMPVRAALASAADIAECLKSAYGVGAEMADRLQAESESGRTIEIPLIQEARLEDTLTDASISRFVNQLLVDAFRSRATDVHIEPYQNDLRIRYRIDGVLHDVPVPEVYHRFHAAVVSRLKVMAGLDIAEKRLPQDGSIKARIGDEELDLRASILPTQFGETVDIRLLSRSSVLLGLERLGLLPRDLDSLENMIKRPHGVILVTGPTGSGKTTTLYACLSRINDASRKIITIEDPIEYQLRGITQIQVHPKIGLTFARGLRSMLRHDPDVMMVGEIRDHETAEVAIQVALTGHLVFSTLHTNDAAGAATRLVNMGVEPYLVASSVTCMMAQRLVRLVCPHCKKPAKENLEALGVDVSRLEGIGTPDFYVGSGCEECKFTGYLGRTAVYEILPVGEEMAEAITARASARKIVELGRKKGFRTLREDGLTKAAMGLTTVAEVLRVTSEEAGGNGPVPI